MEIEINYVVILVCAVLAMGVGFLWFGPLFGKKWMEVNNLNSEDLAKRAEMQKSAGPLYVLQFVLVLIQLYILAHFIKGWDEVSGIESAVWIWLGFVMPTIAGSSMWNANPSRVKWTMFLMQAGYQLVCFVLFGYILGNWG